LRYLSLYSLALVAFCLNINGCLFLIAGGAAEGGYLAGKDQKASRTVSNQVITTKIKSKLIANRDVKARNINVDTSGGVVTLRGFVKTSEQAKKAVAIAKKTKGVKKVISKLTVSP